MSTTTPTSIAVRLRDYGENLGDFSSLLVYPETRRGTSQRTGDQALLAHLYAACAAA